MRKVITIEISAADRARLETVVADRNSPRKHVWRAGIILATASGILHFQSPNNRPKKASYHKDVFCIGVPANQNASHLPPLSDYDEPRTLSYQINLFGPIGADVRQSGLRQQ